VLATVTVTKTVYSTADSFAMLKAFQDGTQIFEGETGLTINEPMTIAVKTTVEAAVVELIKEGERKGVWDYTKVADVDPNATPKSSVTLPLSQSKNTSGLPADVAAKEGVVKK
jgi:hypothetical protein